MILLTTSEEQILIFQSVFHSSQSLSALDLTEGVHVKTPLDRLQDSRRKLLFAFFYKKGKFDMGTRVTWFPSFQAPLQLFIKIHL